MKKRKTGKVYKPQGRQFWGLVVVIAINIIHFAVTSLIFQNLFWFLTGILLPIYAFILFRTFIAATQTSIAIHEDGIEYHYGNSSAFSTWDNVKHINKLGIFLHQPIKPVVDGGFIDKLLLWRRTMTYIPFSDLVHVPRRWLNYKQGFVIDFEKFANTAFGRDLRHYAPHLLAAYTEYKPKHRLEDDGGELVNEWESNHGEHKTQTTDRQNL